MPTRVLFPVLSTPSVVMKRSLHGSRTMCSSSTTPRGGAPCPQRAAPGRRPGCGVPCRAAEDDSPALVRPLAVPRLPTHPSVARRHHRLRRAAGVLGCGARNRLGDGADQSVPRISVTDPGRAGGPYRRGAGLAHPLLRGDGPAAARRSRRAPAHPPGGPGGVPASGGGETCRGRRRWSSASMRIRTW